MAEGMPFAIEEDTSIYPMLAELTACLCNALGTSKPCFCGIIAGADIPVEYVGECADDVCGAAYVRVVGAYPTSNFPEALAAPSCNTVMAYNLAVGVLRCASVGEEDGGPVNQEEFEKTQLLVLSDMKAIRRAIQCCFMRSFSHVRHVMGVYTPLPLEGGVVGGEWPLAILEDF